MNNKLKVLREINNYTQNYIAEDILSISQNTYSRIEQNPNKITAEQAHKLADLYKVSIDDILSEKPFTLSFNTNNHPSNELISLREEVKYLRSQNLELLKILENLSCRQ